MKVYKIRGLFDDTWYVVNDKKAFVMLLDELDLGVQYAIQINEMDEEEFNKLEKA